MPYAHWAGSGLWWPVFPMFWVLLWGTAIFLAVRARRRGWNAGHTPPASARATGSAEVILAERYARGEMTGDEYYERLSVLREGRA